LRVETLTFLRGHCDKRRYDLINILLLTLWALDGSRVALFEALVYGKRLITILTVIFVRRHAHSLHSYNGLHLLP
jgi:hypothetical protein